MSSPLLRWRWHCSGRHALHRRGPSPHPVGLYRAHFTLESVRVGEISSRDGQHRPTHRVTHSRRDRREDRPRGVLKLDVREELAERANRVGHVYAHRLFAIIRSLATYQGRRCEMRRDGSLPDATQIRRLQVVTSHLQHRPRVAGEREHALHRSRGDVLKARTLGAVRRTTRCLSIQGELHVHPSLSVRRGLTCNGVVVQKRSRGAGSVHLALEHHSAEVPHVRQVRSGDCDDVTASGGTLSGVDPLNFRHFVSDCARVGRSGRSEAGPGPIRTGTNNRKKRIWAPPVDRRR